MAVGTAERTFAGPEDAHPHTIKLSNAAIVVAAGVLLTGLPQPAVLASLPISNILMTRYGMSQAAVASFFLVCSIPWFLKPFAGLLSDSFPFLGSRRRSYVLISTALASISWIALAFASNGQRSLLAGCILVNSFLVIGSAAIGGVLVEAGKESGATGRLTSLRVGIQNLVYVVSSLLGGLLATRAFGLTAGVCAVMVAALLPVAYLFLTEPPAPMSSGESLASALAPLKALLGARELWLVLLAMTLYYFAPGFATVQLFRQRNIYALTWENIGFLGSVSAILGIGSSLGYAYACRKLNWRSLAAMAVVLSAAGNLRYLAYSKNVGWDSFIEAQNGFSFALCVLVLYDLAARVIPRGCEAMGYGLLIALQSLMFMGANAYGAAMADKGLPFWALICLNSGTTLLVLAVLPFLPAALQRARDGK